MPSESRKTETLLLAALAAFAPHFAPVSGSESPAGGDGKGAGEGAGGVVVVRAPEKGEGSVILDRAPAGTRFDARGLVLAGGESSRFSSPVRFCLFSDPRRNPAEGIGYPETGLLDEWELPNPERYPIQLRDLADPSISGFTVLGRQSRELPWRVIKAMWDGDALHVKGCTGRVDVTDVYWENVEDGFGPNRGLRFWSLRNAYMRYIRDDAIENDDLIPGEVVNCLIDGCFVFLSQRSEPPRMNREVTAVRDCVIHIEPQPHDGIPGKRWRDQYIRTGADGMGRAPGMIFKWEDGAGKVDVKNCVIRVDAVSVNGPEDLRFPPGRYEDVTLVWLGEGAYPRPLPEGVRLTRDPTVWAEARRAWIARLPASHPAAPLLKSQAAGG